MWCLPSKSESLSEPARHYGLLSDKSWSFLPESPGSGMYSISTRSRNFQTDHSRTFTGPFCWITSATFNMCIQNDRNFRGSTVATMNET